MRSRANTQQASVMGEFMDRQKILAWGAEKMRFAHDAPLEPGYRYYHGLRVARLAVELARTMQLRIDQEALFVGGFLHDVGKAGYNGPDHGPRGAELIRAEIAHLFNAHELDGVTAIVANHYMRPNSHHFAGRERPVFPAEVLLVQDADLIDHFGSNGIWLAFRWSVYHGRNQQESLDFYHGQDVSWRREALESVNFAVSRDEIASRMGRAAQFMSYWQLEEKGELTAAMKSSGARLEECLGETAL